MSAPVQRTLYLGGVNCTTTTIEGSGGCKEKRIPYIYIKRERKKGGVLTPNSVPSALELRILFLSLEGRGGKQIFHSFFADWYNVDLEPLG